MASLQKSSQFRFDFKKINFDVIDDNKSDLKALQDQIDISVDGHNANVCATVIQRDDLKFSGLSFLEAKLRPVYLKGVDTSNTFINTFT